MLFSKAKSILSCAVLIATSSVSHAADAPASGDLNPEEGAITQLTQSIDAHQDRDGFACRVVYEAQKGGLHEDAMTALRTSADSGNVQSMILMSHAYENGLGVPKDQ
jgi:TPR repeat protein